jgi:hypothetical protein
VTADLEPVLVGLRWGIFLVHAGCEDAFDPAPATLAALNGVAVEDGLIATLIVSRRELIHKTRSSLVMTGPSFELLVTCSDAAGNVSSATAVPIFREP